MHATLVCEIVGYDQSREVIAIRAADGVNFERLEPGEPGPATLTLRLPEGSTFKVTLANEDFQQHVAPLMWPTQAPSDGFTLRFADGSVKIPF
jgi:hypothetical protein